MKVEVKQEKVGYRDVFVAAIIMYKKDNKKRSGVKVWVFDFFFFFLYFFLATW